MSAIANSLLASYKIRILPYMHISESMSTEAINRKSKDYNSLNTIIDLPLVNAGIYRRMLFSN